MNNDERLIYEIIDIIFTPGEEMNDGECMDAVLHLLSTNGYHKEIEQYQQKGKQ